MKIATVKAHTRTIRPSYDPEVHLCLKTTIDLEAWFEMDMLNVLADLRAELASKRQSFLASLETV